MTNNHLLAQAAALQSWIQNLNVLKTQGGEISVPQELLAV